MDVPGDAGSYLPTQKAVQKTIDRVDDPSLSTASKEGRPFATQGAVLAQRVHADANALDPREALEGHSSVFANGENQESKSSIV